MRVTDEQILDIQTVRNCQRPAGVFRGTVEDDPGGHHVQVAVQRHPLTALQVGWGPGVIVVEYRDERGRLGLLQPG